MEFEDIAGHTVDLDLITNGVIIDCGCRAFSFAEAFPNHTVYCIDPDPKVFQDPKSLQPNYRLMNVAISDKAGDGFMYLNQSCPEGSTLKEFDPDQSHPFTPCKTITMDDLYAITGTNVDVLKLDCEGAEYIILDEGFKPIPKQVSVEFHNHTVPELHAKHFEAIKQRLLEHYEIFNEVAEPRHGCGINWWDVLFIRKDLLNV